MERLADRFVLEREIGAGGMSVVYLGRDEVLDRPVAVKVLRSGFEDSDVGTRFRREGRTAARLSHPNVVQVYDAGEDVLDGREVSYIVMEHVPGGDLKGMIDENGSIEERELARIMGDVVSGLAHAHELGVIHRDIKPHNILIDGYGRAKLTDFGIAKALDATQATQTGFYLGTALYSSPEQLRGEPATPKSDVYALGATLYHAALGALPFKGGPIEVASQQLSRPVTPPRARGAEIGARLDRLIVRCLSKDPTARPEISDLQAELLSVRAAANVSPGTAAPPPSVAEALKPAVENVLAAIVAAMAGAVRAVRSVGAKGAARFGSAARGIRGSLGANQNAGDKKGEAQGVPTRPVTLPTRTFRSGYEPETLISSAFIALILLFLLVWAIVSIFSGPETASSSDNGQQVAGRHPGAGGSEAGGAGSGSAETDGARGLAAEEKDAKEQQPSGPTPPEGQAADVVYEMYLDSVGDDDYGASWNMLSSRLQEEVGSREQWAKRQSTLTSFSITGEELRTDRVEGGKAYVYGEVQTNRTSGSETLEGPWVLVAQSGQWKVDETPDQ